MHELSQPEDACILGRALCEGAGHRKEQVPGTASHQDTWRKMRTVRQDMTHVATAQHTTVYVTH